ncbi:hypothetical protein [Adhaeribacter pallidiroseus]|uniref:hypothetical protein n=1 Tax=Adhaeribacter pallidiroseus TaxID=2072847 RepID=UPI0011C02BAC|nr:hypothetical protein [Adhaeribacter pallidiroseus]
MKKGILQDLGQRSLKLVVKKQPKAQARYYCLPGQFLRKSCFISNLLNKPPPFSGAQWAKLSPYMVVLRSFSVFRD